MTVKRQLLNFGGRSVDFRLGENAIDELSSLARGAVGRPRRAALVLDGTLGPERELVVARSLEDAGFEVRTHAVPAGPKSVDDAVALMDLFAADAITSEDLIVGAGAIHTMGLVSFSAKLWCGGAQSLLVPSTLDAMVIAATSALPLSTPGSSGMVELRPEPTMVVADLSLAEEAGPEANAAGFTLMVGTHLADGKRSWDRLGGNIARLVEGDSIALSDAVATSQTARRTVLSAANPSARAALEFGVTTARALRACLGEDCPWWQLLAEGMRFEARLAVDAASYPVDDMFDLDDRLFDLGIEELAFDLDADRFLEAIRTERFRRCNRLLFALPRTPGTIRLTSVEDEVLERHAEAYLSSRRELFRGDA